MPTPLAPPLPPDQGYPTGTYPTAGTWGYPVTPAAPASSGYPQPTAATISPTSKQVNTGTFDLIVKGTNFTASSQVAIGGTAQPTTVIDDRTLLTSQTSQGKTAGAVQVTVTNAGGLASTPTLPFTYTP